MPRAKDKSKRVVGLVCPERYYTIEAAKRYAGIGRPQLIDARKAGVITTIPVGRFQWIRGEQIIAWIEWHAQKLRASPISTEGNGPEASNKPPKERHSERPAKELLTRLEAADLLGLKPKTLTVWASDGRYGLPMVKVGRSVRYRRSDLEAFINARMQPRNAEQV